MGKVYLSLGTNLGNKKENLEHALKLLSEKIGILKVSSFYETEPVGYSDQPWFLNIAVKGTTDLSPDELIEFTQSIEHEMKRVKTIINGPRIIDVDILLYDDVKINTDKLTIPHPRMTERAFVMYPLHEISPELTIEGKNIKDIIKCLEG